MFEPDTVRDERAKLLRSIKIMKPEEVAAYAVAGAVSRIPAGEGRGSELANRYLRRSDVLHR